MNQKRAGFTLIELLLYVGIISVVIVGASAFLGMAYQSRIKSETIAEVEQQGEQVLSLITQTIRNSESINSPATGTRAAILSLNVVATSSDPTIFDSATGTMRIKEGSGAIVTLTSDRVVVSDLVFHNVSRTPSPGSVRVQFLLTHVNPGNRNEYAFSRLFYGSASLRQP